MPELEKSEILVFRVEFTHQGFFHCAQQSTGTIPLLQRMVYQSSPIERSIYHFNGPLPFHMQTEAGEQLMKVTFFGLEV